MTSTTTRSFVLVSVLAALVFVSSVPTTAEAQRRVRRAAPVIVIGGYGYHSYWRYDPWSRWGPWGPYGYPRYYYGVYDRLASLRIDAEPRQAQVFVDGYYAGLVDDFDGVFQRLRLEPGGHTITLFLEGYRTEEHRLYLPPAHDQRLRVTMVPLASGELSVPPTPAPASDEEDEWDGGETEGPREPVMPPRSEGPREGPRQGEVRTMPARFGTLALRVEPDTAEVFIDGERWGRRPEQGLLRIELAEGRHRVEVRQGDVVTYGEDVLIRRDRTLTLNVRLR